MNIITSRTPEKAGNAGHGPEYHKPSPVDVPHKYRARQAASLWERESTRRQGRGNEVGPGEGAPARMAVCDTAGRKAAGGGDESAARVDASCEQPVKPGRFLTSHRPRMTGDGNGTGNPQVILQERDASMTTSEAINERIEALNEELSAIHQAQNISRCWAGNHTALLNLDRREAEVCRAINILSLNRFA